jgi:hypothetical protein
MEAKQGSDQQLHEQLALFGSLDAPTRKGTAVRGTRTWTAAMQRARGQAERYAKALPVEHGWPPFLIIVDVGHCIELYADFSLTGNARAKNTMEKLVPDSPAADKLVLFSPTLTKSVDASRARAGRAPTGY